VHSEREKIKVLYDIFLMVLSGSSTGHWLKMVDMVRRGRVIVSASASWSSVVDG
jgi:hypothetical protein